MKLLEEALVYLVAALIFVPISRRLGLGSILGYLAAGIAIGPYGLRLISDPEHILHFAELGVVLLLFIVGLELKPARLWVMRKMVFGLGALQVIVSAAAIAGLAALLGLDSRSAVIVGLVLALSSTAFVLQMLAEQQQLTSTHGRAAFSVLLFQDLAAIPLIAFLPFLAAGNTDLDASGFLFGALALAALIVPGRYLLRPVLHIAVYTRLPEIFTASALLVVIGAALLMHLAGLSMILGAFIAGMLLADSEYRHQLEGDIAPFKGLLLGLFFIAVGMTVNLGLLLEEPLRILVIVALLMFTKAAVLLPLSLAFDPPARRQAVRVAALLAQGGEFAFVLLGIAARDNILAPALIDELVLAVALSMLLTPLIYFAVDRRLRDRGEASDAHSIPEDEDTPIVVAGFGRVGQIIGRTLRAVDMPFTALDFDPEQVGIVRRFGSRVHFGDATRLDVLRAAGTGHARVIVIALADMESSLRVAKTIRQHFPGLKIVARARNRRHAHKLMDLGVDHIVRDTLLSSMAMAEHVLEELKLPAATAKHVARTFLDRDEALLRDQHAVHDSEEKLIQSHRDAAEELTALLKNDLQR